MLTQQDVLNILMKLITIKCIKNKIMKIEMLMNGVQKVVLIPENALETAFLESFSKAGNIGATLIDKQMPILNNIIHEGLIIETKKEL